MRTIISFELVAIVDTLHDECFVSEQRERIAGVRADVRDSDAAQVSVPVALADLARLMGTQECTRRVAKLVRASRVRRRT